jgi:hypothetical protein
MPLYPGNQVSPLPPLLLHYPLVNDFAIDVAATRVATAGGSFFTITIAGASKTLVAFIFKKANFVCVNMSDVILKCSFHQQDPQSHDRLHL